MMIRRTIAAAVTVGALFSGCLGFSHAQAASPKTDIYGKQADKALFDRAMKAMQQAEYARARALLATLINRHPDSDLVPPAKLSIADSLYTEGTFKQAEGGISGLRYIFPAPSGGGRSATENRSYPQESKNLRRLCFLSRSVYNPVDRRLGQL